MIFCRFINTMDLHFRSIFNRHVCSNGRWGKPARNGGDTGVATRTKSNKKNRDGDGDGDNVEQNKLMASDFLLYLISVGGLDATVSDEDLKQPFSQFGEIVSMKIPIAKGLHSIIEKFAEHSLRSLGRARQLFIIQSCTKLYHAKSPTHQLAIAKEIVRRLRLGVNMYPSSTLLGDHKDNFVAALIEKADGFVGVFPALGILGGSLGDKAAEDLKERVIEHNILVVSKYYARITVKRLA
ncbi:plasma membrane ATPase 1-like protein [Tanacetum coccineum]|uniref:Plasma membrane ATPase 1-like protein n=1 Tax=Tanacetum coccineum TaxID=301880 RepID=A0ABQ5AA48_9ASTR